MEIFKKFFLFFGSAVALYFVLVFYLSFNALTFNINALPVEVLIEPFDLPAVVQPVYQENCNYSSEEKAVDFKTRRFDKRFLRNVLILLPRGGFPAVRKVRVLIGKRVFDFSNEEFLKQWTKVSQGDTDVFIGREGIMSSTTKFAKIQNAMNWGGDQELFKISFFLWVFCVCLGGLLVGGLRMLLSQRWAGGMIHWADNVLWDRRESVSQKRWRGWALVGLLFLVFCLMSLERMRPNFFLKDDNIVQFLPPMIQGMRSLFDDGIFPTFDPYQFNGMPTLSLGYYGLAYPFTYVSYAIARYLLGNEYLLIEVFAFIHFILGYFVCLMFFKTLKSDPLVGVIGSVSFLLSGYNLIFGRSWYYMLPVMVYFPALMVSCLYFVKKEISIRWALVTGILTGCFFYAGNAQMWVYGMMFFYVVIFLNLFRRELWRKVPYLISASLIGIALALPLAALISFEVSQISREGNLGCGIGAGIFSMFFPYPAARSIHPMNYASSATIGQMYYNGTFFNIIWLMGAGLFVTNVFFIRRNLKDIQKIFIDNVWLLVSFLAFLLALGNPGFFWGVMEKIPPFNQFKWPFKFLPFVNFFNIAAAVIFLQRLSGASGNKKSAWRYGLILLFPLLFYHVNLCKDEALGRNQDQTYPPLEESVLKIFQSDGGKPQRVCKLGYIWGWDKGYFDSLPFNLPSVYRIPSFTGYEPLIQSRPVTKDDFYHYGVKYIFISSISNGGDSLPVPEGLEYEGAVQFKNFMVMGLKNAEPLAFVKDHPQISFPIDFNGQGARIDLSSSTGIRDIVVGLQYRKGMSAFADKKKHDIETDAWGRVVVKQVPPAKTLVVKYIPSVGAMGVVSGILFFAGVGLSGMKKFYDFKFKRKTA